MLTTIINPENNNLYLQFNEVFLPNLDQFGKSSTNEVFFISLDPILRPICGKIEKEIYKKRSGMPGRYPFPVIAMLKAHLYTKLNNDMSYRALQREVYRVSGLEMIFGFKSIPSHQAMSDFRKRLGIDKLNQIFYHVINTAIEILLTDTNETIVDSAPIKTNVNFARANKTDD